ncbi:MAG TPA: hypothetical protein VGP41_09505 [Candidatus Lustribacter sp.]|nr:hypothetical protein [Candidatus Lustribacter sp.]
MKLALVIDAERQRLLERDTVGWDRWGPYLSERAWGTVREDYSADGTAWEYFPHDHARSRAYRWSEDGIGGYCDREQFLCFALALWNGRDPILKERMFGLTNREGNHGEDVKEYYYFLDNTPTHSYMRYLYKYPQAAYPYDELVRENAARSRNQPEYELLDTGVFDDGRYFDVELTYAKASSDETFIQITIANRGPDAAEIVLLPTLWFRNTWNWGRDDRTPALRGTGEIVAEHWSLGRYRLQWDEAPDDVLFTGNETNNERLFGVPSRAPYVKDAFHRYVIGGERDAVNPARTGTKAAALYRRRIAAGSTYTLRLRLAPIGEEAVAQPFDAFDATLAQRKAEADAFYAPIIPEHLTADAKNVARQAYAGLLWSKQFYHYVVAHWLDGDPGNVPPPEQRKTGRNSTWRHLYSSDIIAMPDTWEFPWFASWDLAFHCVALAYIDPQFAKEQIVWLSRSWYMNEDGQLPAYEWGFDDVNPPALPLAAICIYRMEEALGLEPDRDFLQRVFHKAIITFTWWANRKDAQGSDIFAGGFLGLDNIGPFDRGALPPGYQLGQVDGTSWMAAFSATLFEMAVILTERDPGYADIASKFRDHFATIAYAMNRGPTSLWDETDGFFYDHLRHPDGSDEIIRARTAIGFIPLFEAVALGKREFEEKSVAYRGHWVVSGPDVPADAPLLAPVPTSRFGGLLVNEEQLRRILAFMFDSNEFFSDFGIRSTSRALRERPFTTTIGGRQARLDYEPGESTTDAFGGNSNWRGPIWMPVNFLLLQALENYGRRLDIQIECPVGSGTARSLHDAAGELARRLGSIFLRGADGRRPVNGTYERFNTDPHWRDLIAFHEYFHGETGRGCGASHQTGWTSLIAPIMFRYPAQFSEPAASANVK